MQAGDLKKRLIVVSLASVMLAYSSVCLNAPAYAETATVTYTYDSLNRLVGAVYTEGAKTSAIDYTYDSAGNMTGYTGTAPEMDFGDAPDSYGTLQASNGARHVIVVGDRMGPTMDAETNGQPSPLADGDDTNGAVPDDEDGVGLSPLLTPGDSAAPVTVDGGPAGGFLDAWIDFNGNGVFDHPAEQLFGGSQSLTPGLNSLTFAVPSEASTGFTYARFRLSPTGGLLPTGLASSGEVEDYRVEIATPSSTTTQETTTYQSSSTTTIGYSSTTTVGNSSTTTVGNSSTTTIAVSSSTTTVIGPVYRYVDKDGACGGLTPCYTSIQAAIDAAGTEDTIRITDETYNENVSVDQNKALTLEGGWNSSFTNNPSTTVIKGTMTISDESTNVEKVDLRSP